MPEATKRPSVTGDSDAAATAAAGDPRTAWKRQLQRRTAAAVSSVASQGLSFVSSSISRVLAAASEDPAVAAEDSAAAAEAAAELGVDELSLRVYKDLKKEGLLAELEGQLRRLVRQAVRDRVRDDALLAAAVRCSSSSSSNSSSSSDSSSSNSSSSKGRERMPSTCGLQVQQRKSLVLAECFAALSEALDTEISTKVK